MILTASRRISLRQGFSRAAALLALVILLAPPGRAPAQEDISEFEKRLAKIHQDIRNLRARIEEVTKQESTLLSQLGRIALTKKLIRNELAALTLRREKLSEELAATRETIASLRRKLGQEQRSIEKTLVTLYKYGKFNFLQFLLEAESMNAVFSESRHLAALARHQQDVISAYLKTMDELRKAEGAQAKQSAEVAALISEADAKSRELEAQEAKNRSLIQEIQRNRKSYEQALQEQKERAEHLQSLMDKLASQEIVLPFRFVPLYERKGKLPWPIAGRVITRFGIERHLNTSTMNNGIDIAPAKDDTIIRSIHPGKVVFADFFQGYGNLLIIDHGMNYYTLYGHCDEFMAGKGEFVREGQPIAVAGDIGSLKGVTLYLEVRYKTKPLDPLQWLKRR
ncbi:MAG: peptidoglycan DD-metalloendopeptidase family protein [Candidatus Aminicenantales bacterium]